MTVTTTDRIRAVCLAQTAKERKERFYEIVRIAAETGGILLDSDLTTELVILGELLGITVEWERVQLPVFGKPTKDAAGDPRSGKKAKEIEQWKSTNQASIFGGR